MTGPVVPSQVGGGGYMDSLNGFLKENPTDLPSVEYSKEQDLAFDIASFAFLYNALAFDHRQVLGLGEEDGEAVGGGFFGLGKKKDPGETLLADYVKLMEAPMKMVNEFAKNLYGAKSGLLSKVSKLFSKSDGGFSGQITVIVPDWKERHSRVVFRFEEKKKETVYQQFDNEAILAHLTNQVLKPHFAEIVNAEEEPAEGDPPGTAPEGATPPEGAANPAPPATDPSGAPQVPAAAPAAADPPGPPATPGAAAQGGGLFGLGKKLDQYEHLVVAANAHQPKNESWKLTETEQLALSVFTVFYTLYMRGVGNIRTDAKFLQAVFAGVHSATGCMVFSSAVYNEQQHEQNTDEKYEKENRFFVVTSPVDTVLDDAKKAFRRDFAKQRFKQVAPKAALEHAAEWVKK